jgi:hypothetical protein
MSMNRGIVAVALVVAGGLAQVIAADEVTVKGEIVEVSCYSKQGVAKGTGAAHLSCAVDCAKQGKPLGVLTDGDGLYKFVGDYTDNNNAKLIPFVGKQVEVKGTLDRYTDYTTAIKPSKITLTK